ncbi:MAG: tryptophan synthase subunit alpha, partial [Spirochaetota bacterium]
PSTPFDRMAQLASASLSPFVSAVMRLGVTGRKTDLDAAALAYLADVKKAVQRFVAAGFGIAEKSQIDDLAGYADCAIIGSAITRTLTRAAEEGKDPAAEIEKFMKGIK